MVHGPSILDFLLYMVLAHACSNYSIILGTGLSFHELLHVVVIFQYLIEQFFETPIRFFYAGVYCMLPFVLIVLVGLSMVIDY